MSDFSPLDDDVLLKGTLIIRAVERRGHRPARGRTVLVRACGYT